MNDLKKAAIVHKIVRQQIRNKLKPGLKIIEVCNELEELVRKYTKYDPNNPLLGGNGFPTGFSLNNCAAHWTPNPGDNTILQYDDVAKIDFGVHINGYIIDSAFTHTFNPKYDTLLQASKEATYAGIKLAGVDTLFSEIGSTVQEIIESYEIELNGKIIPIKSVDNLCGHSILPYKIHAGKSIPNISMYYPVRMEENEVYAIETFASTGKGHVDEVGECSHFMIDYTNDYKSIPIANKQRGLMDIIEKHRSTLAFCPKWIAEYYPKYQKPLKQLVKSKVVKEYPPLCDIPGSYVAQFEHTISLFGGKKVVLSEADDY